MRCPGVLIPHYTKRAFSLLYNDKKIAVQWVKTLEKQSVRFTRTDVINPDLKAVLDPRYNKGLSFSLYERQMLSIVGLLPPTFRTVDEQIYSVKANFDRYVEPLNKYMYLAALRSRHERLFYRFVNEHIEDVMPIVYTPTVGLACQNYGFIYRKPTGLYITMYDRCHIKDVLENWRDKPVRAICVTDGERILGLGDLGASGMGIAVGKLELYTALAGVKPVWLLPIMLDVGTNNKLMLSDPLYIGIRQKRVKGVEYDDFVDEFMKAAVELYGPRVLIHFEDFATPTAFKLLQKYGDNYCCFNDDIQGTAATGIAGMLTAERVTRKSIKDHIFLFAGSGSASTGIALLLLKELVSQGLSEEEACCHIFLSDVHGLITSDRKNIEMEHKLFAKTQEPIKDFEKLVEIIKPTMLIGATGVGGIFTEKVLRIMSANNEHPVILALSNPNSKAECTPEQAYTYTEGRAIFASGSPFPPVIINGKTYAPSQANNCLVFPGIASGVILSRAKNIPEEIFLIAAKTLSNLTNDEEIEKGSLYPSMSRVHDIAIEIAVQVAVYIFEKDLSDIIPIPKDMNQFIRSQLYSYEYGESLPPLWDYPEIPHVPIPKGMKLATEHF